MKVLIIHTAYKFKGGEDTVVANEMSLLRGNGVTVDLLQFSNEGNTLMKVLFLPFNDSSYWKTIKKIQAFNPDIVHIHNLHFGGSPAVFYAVKRCGVPFVVTVHNYRMLCPSATLYANGRIYTESVNKSFSWKAITDGVYQESKLLTFWISCSMYLHQKLGTYNLPSAYIALGEHTRNVFADSKLRSIARHMSVKPNFCYNDAVFSPVTGDYYLFVGRLSEEKGVTTLLGAFIKNKLPLKIAGTGPLNSEVLAACKTSPNITWLGQVDKPAIDQLLTNAKALIFPSQWQETFGMVIIEAFGKSVPVIVSSLGQPREMVGDYVNGLHFKPGDKDDLIKAVDTFENMPAETKFSLRKEAFATYQQKYAPEINAALLMGIYQTVIKSHTIEGFSPSMPVSSLKCLILVVILLFSCRNQQAIRHLAYQKYHYKKYLADSLKFNRIKLAKEVNK